jgi:predicted DCC family thiol-disulfide oxidoreductase YuxK
MSAQLIYDQDCPFCKMYSKAFVSTGLLQKEERISFSEVNDEELLKLVDWNKARNEIPFIDKAEGKVYYGVDALLKVLSAKLTFFRWFARNRSLVLASKILYAFISYNRRVIMPAKESSCGPVTSPQFNLRYRIAYLISTWIITAAILTAYARHLEPLAGKAGSLREYIICGGQIFFQTSVLLLYRKRTNEIFEYLGNMMSISLGGSILLLPMLAAGIIHNHLPAEAYALYFLIVAGLMFLEHVRRMKLIHLPFILSATWVFYRIIVLLIILPYGN